MLKRLSLTIMAAVFVVCIGNADQSKKNVIIPVNKTAPTSGKQMYANYCAPCHGVDGRGHGPVAPALKVPPGDSTVLSKNDARKIPGYPHHHFAAEWRGHAGARHGGNARVGPCPW